MAEVLHGAASGDQLNASADKTQVYGLKGNDTLTAQNKSDVLLVGGSGDDSLIISGGNGTLSGGDGSDVFNLNYSATNKLSAVIEDLNPSLDKIVVNFDGNTSPNLSSVVSGSDVIWRDGDLLSVTLKSVRDNDYYDGSPRQGIFGLLEDITYFNVLQLTNVERENENLPLLTLSDGLTKGASIRAEEITSLGNVGLLTDHTRPNGTDFSTVFDDVDKHYSNFAENLDGGAESESVVVNEWMNSEAHRTNILNADYKKLGVGYNYDDADESNLRRYWTQLFGDSLVDDEKETVTAAELSTAQIETNVVTNSVTLTAGDDTYSNTVNGATIQALGGNDSITNSQPLVSISGGTDNDTVNDSGAFGTINLGSGDDFYISDGGQGATILGGTGDDRISLDSSAGSNLIQYSTGDGNDTISGLHSTDTLSISGSAVTPVTVGNDIILAAGLDSITLVDGVTSSNFYIIAQRSKLYILTENDDSHTNNIDDATIQALGGNDYLTINGMNVTVDGGTGKDTITNFGGTSENDFISNSTLNGGAGDDSIRNVVRNVLIFGGHGDDYLNNAFLGRSDVTIDAGTGNDFIFNNMLSSYVSILGGYGNDTVNNAGMYATIDAGTGNDFISNTEFAFNSSMTGDGGNDYVINNASGATIEGSDGNDYIRNYGESSIIDGGTGNDSLENEASSVAIIGLDGNEIIYNEGSNVSIDGGRDNDLIVLRGDGQNNLIQYADGDGRDVVDGMKTSDTLQIGGGNGTFSAQTVGSHVVVNVGTGNIILWDAASLSAVNIEGTQREVEESDEDDSIFQLTDGDDNFSSSLEGAVVLALGGNDTISNTGNDAAINGAAGNDSIDNAGNNVIILGEDGNDSFSNSGSNVSISGNTGENYFDNTGENVLIFGGSGNDTISDSGQNNTLAGGEGNDEIYFVGEAQNNLIRYTAGDGDDSVSGFGLTDTLMVITAPNNYSTETIGNDVVVNVGTNTLTLWDAADLPSVNIVITSDGAGEDEKYIPLTDGDDRYLNRTSDVTIAALGGNDSIKNYGAQVSIGGADGNDTLENRSERVTISGDSGDDNINSYGDEVLIDGGSDNNTIYSSGVLVTISTSDGDDSIRTNSGSDSVSVVTGAGNDTIYNGSYPKGSNNATIISGAGDDSILNYGDSVSIDTGDGNDHIDVFSMDVTVDAGAGNDYVNNMFSGGFVSGGAGSDYIYNSGDSSTLDGGDDDDRFTSDGDDVSITGGAGNDLIENEGNNVSITGGTGDDRISLSSDAQNNLINYSLGDGDDTIWGLDANDTLNITEENYSSVVSGDDIIFNVGNGSVTLVDARDKPLHIIIGSSGSAGGNSGNDGGSGDGGNSSGGDGGNNNGDGGNNSGGGSGSESSGGNSQADSDGRSTSGTGSSSGGRSTGGSGGNNDSAVRIATSTRTNYTNVIPTAAPITTTTTTPTTSTATTSIATNQTPNQIYSGGNQVITNYNSGEAITFGETYTGAFYDGDGNLFVGSTSGALVIQNAVDKVVDLRDGAGNEFIKAYSASTASVIDGRGLNGFELINGSTGSDIIQAGDGGSQLWGGNDSVTDALLGGNGTDIFVTGKSFGSDAILNSATNDIVNFADSTLSDIVATAGDGNTVGILFNTGNVVTIQSTNELSSAVVLADGSAYRFNHSTKAWQGA